MKKLLEIIKKLKNAEIKLRLSHIVSACLAIILIIILLMHGLDWITDNLTLLDTMVNRSDPPYYKKVMEIIKPLRYSGYPDLIKEDVRIEVDFIKRKWYLRNIHKFDKNGNIILTEGRYGLCGELAAYTYQRIKPIFGNEYDIKFVKAAVSGYFIQPRASHVVLKITERSFLLPKSYIIDPSFNIYAGSNSYSFVDSYIFLSEDSSSQMLDNRDSDRILDIGQSTPIFIKKEFIVQVGVNDVAGVFNRDNFSIMLLATKRNKFVGRSLFVMRKYKGEKSIVKNEFLGNLILGSGNYAELCQTITRWFNESE